MKHSWRNRSILIVLSLLGAAAPLAQGIRVVEERATADSPARYALRAGMSSALQDLPAENSAAVETQDSKQTEAPRLIRLLTDHWDLAGQISFSAMEAPLVPVGPRLDVPFQPRASITHPIPYASGPPRLPLSRGPPAAA